MAGKFPIPKYYFEVQLMDIGNKVSFKEVKGLSQEFEMVEYREGNFNQVYTKKRIGMVKSAAVTFTKGVFTSDKKVTDVINKQYWNELLFGSTDTKEKTCIINLKNEKGVSKVTWTLKDCVPIKLDFGDLSSDSSEIMIEEIQVNYGLMEVKFN